MSPKGLITIVAGIALMLAGVWLIAKILSALGIYIPWPDWLPH